MNTPFPTEDVLRDVRGMIAGFWPADWRKVSELCDLADRLRLELAKRDEIIAGCVNAKQADVPACDVKCLDWPRCECVRRCP